MKTPDAPLARVRRVRVGSANPPKVEAVRAALEPYVAEPDGLSVVGVAVESGVPEQPVGFGEIVAGARQRARAAAQTGPCDLAVGIEDGLVALDGVLAEPLNVGAAMVTDGERESVGLSSGFAYPPACAAPALAERADIGELFDALWERARGDAAGAAGPSSRGIGNVGKLSLGVLPRSEYARHAVLCALVRFLHPDLYEERPGARQAVA